MPLLMEADRKLAALYGLPLESINQEFKKGASTAREIIDRHFRGRSLDASGALLERGCHRPQELEAFTRREIARLDIIQSADFKTGVDAEIARHAKTIQHVPPPHL